MTAMTAVHAARAAGAAQTKPPVDYTHDAIKAGIAYEAANGPSHVRIKALSQMARITGLFEVGKELGKHLAKQFIQKLATQVAEKVHDGYQRVAELMNGATPTEEDLGRFADFVKRLEAEEDDEEGGKRDEDEPP